MKANLNCTSGFNQCTMIQNSKKHRINTHPIMHSPTSEGVSKVSERANEWARQSAREKRAMWSKRASEQCEQMSERISERLSTYVWVVDWFGSQCNGSFCILSKKKQWLLKDINLLYCRSKPADRLAIWPGWNLTIGSSSYLIGSSSYLIGSREWSEQSFGCSVYSFLPSCISTTGCIPPFVSSEKKYRQLLYH